MNFSLDAIFSFVKFDLIDSFCRFHFLQKISRISLGRRLLSLYEDFKTLLRAASKFGFKNICYKNSDSSGGRKRLKEMRQLNFAFTKDYKKEFGGSLLLGKRKTKRPLSTKHPIHLVLKSCQKGVFNAGNRGLEKLIRSQAEKFGIKVYDLALNWSHIHLLIKLQNRRDYVRFVRSLSSILAEKIRSAKADLKQVFTLRPYTRIMTWGRDLKTTFDYISLNQMESFGFFKRFKMKNKKGKFIKGQRSHLLRTLQTHF